MKTGELGKREQIINAAVVVFSQKGFYAATVEEIALEAGVGKGTVYEYFNSKKDLFQKMVMETSSSYFENLDSLIEEKGTVLEKLKLILECHLKFLKEHKEMAGIIMAEHNIFSGELKQWMSKMQQKKFQVLKNLVEEGIAGGEFRKMDSHFAANMISASIFSASKYLFMDSEKSVSDIADSTIDLLAHGLRR